MIVLVVYVLGVGVAFAVTMDQFNESVFLTQLQIGLLETYHRLTLDSVISSHGYFLLIQTLYDLGHFLVVLKELVILAE